MYYSSCYFQSGFSKREFSKYWEFRKYFSQFPVNLGQKYTIISILKIKNILYLELQTANLTKQTNLQKVLFEKKTPTEWWYKIV